MGLDLLVGLESTGFLLLKVTILPFVVNKYLVSGDFETVQTLHLLGLLPTNFDTASGRSYLY